MTDASARQSFSHGRTGVLKGAGLPDASSPPHTREASAGRLPTGRRKRELTENEIQKAVFLNLRTRGAPGIFAFHPKNGSSDMAGRKAGIYTALGVEPGVPDVIVLQKDQFGDFLARPSVFGLELKRESLRGKKMTKHEVDQEKTRKRMALVGVTTGVAYGLDDALTWLERYDLLIGRRA